MLFSCNLSKKKENIVYEKLYTGSSPDISSFSKYLQKESKTEKPVDTNVFLTFIEKFPKKTRDELKQSLTEINNVRMKKE